MCDILYNPPESVNVRCLESIVKKSLKTALDEVIITVNLYSSFDKPLLTPGKSFATLLGRTTFKKLLFSKHNSLSKASQKNSIMKR